MLLRHCCWCEPGLTRVGGPAADTARRDNAVTSRYGDKWYIFIRSSSITINSCCEGREEGKGRESERGGRREGRGERGKGKGQEEREGHNHPYILGIDRVNATIRFAIRLPVVE